MRWTDDRVDNPNVARTERMSFIQRQRALVEACYQQQVPDDMSDEEYLVADLIVHGPGRESGLASFIDNMLAIIDFDAERMGRQITERELDWYVDSLSRSVTDGLRFFIGNGKSYPDSAHQYKAAAAAHIAHLLRDTHEDVENGFFNVPIEYLRSNNFGPSDLEHSALAGWVRERVALARRLFREGKPYLDQLGVFRCKVAGYWYCTRFESLLDRIEADDFELRPSYGRRLKLASFRRMARQSVSITFRHLMPAPGR